LFRIVEARPLAPAIKLFRIEAPRIARRRQAGQFVIIRLDERGERIPLTIADSAPEEGTITLIVQGVGKTTMLLNRLEAGDALLDVVGPLGCPSEVELFGTVVVIGGGVGAAIAYPTAVALKRAGNRVVTILGARDQDLLILEQELAAVSDELIVTTDDGSRGRRGLVTDALAGMLADGVAVDRVLAIGPVPMMRAVAEVTRPAAIPTIVSLNSVMVDGTGMCGGCRVIVGGESRFACVDGPEFDAHLVDFAILSQRNAMYREAEKTARETFLAAPEREIERVRSACRLEAAHPEVAAPPPAAAAGAAAPRPEVAR
jgi:ferredoxin/flavodoxin---NADP+ reductase